jgi:hypothetical protein
MKKIVRKEICKSQDTLIVRPNVKNFIKSLRDIGYTFEIAVADVLDNSISANASKITIYTIPKPEILFCMLDNGTGMTNGELIEAMRLATKNPDDERDLKDLGRFGLGLKTASFSQCKKLTVISKKNGQLSLKQWDLDYISETDDWHLLTPSLNTYSDIDLLRELEQMDTGTLVIWENIDRYKSDTFSNSIDKLKKHLALVFHKFLEGENIRKKLKIIVNNDELKPFNPFNADNYTTLQKSIEKIQIYGADIKITPYILPHHKNVSQEEWERYSTDEGYIKSQGFYLYRANRLLIYGTWWGLIKSTDATKLVRIKIDISNDQDTYWGIDIKKSKANPLPELKRDLKRVIHEVIKDGVKPFRTRGRKIQDKTTTKFWEVIPKDNQFYFGVNKEHPIYNKLTESLNEEQKYLFNTFLKGLEAYMPLDAIQSQLQQNPHEVKQNNALTDEEIIELADRLKNSGLDQEYIDSLLKTEIFKNKLELLENE